MRIKIGLTLLVVLISAGNLLADSPITSTDIYKAYESSPIVIEAKKAKGILNKKLMNYLIDEKNPIDKKIALISAISWDINGRNNSKKFFEFLKKKRGYKNKKDFLKRGKPYELLSMAYLRAMDDYFKVDEALIYANKALEKKPDSYTYNIIQALIKAQKEMDNNWCNVFLATDNVRKNKTLKKDLNKKATEIIFKYMDLYKDSCEEKK
jgi:hypothetical protein